MNDLGFEVGWSKYYKAYPITLERFFPTFDIFIERHQKAVEVFSGSKDGGVPNKRGITESKVL